MILFILSLGDTWRGDVCDAWNEKWSSSLVRTGFYSGEACGFGDAIKNFGLLIYYRYRWGARSPEGPFSYDSTI